MIKQSAKNKRAYPLIGVIFSIASGMLVLYMPLQLYWLAFVPGSYAFVGIFLGSLILGCAITTWCMPQYHQIMGIGMMLFSILALIGAFGGLVFGSLLGIVGGAFCFSWQRIPDHE